MMSRPSGAPGSRYVERYAQAEQANITLGMTAWLLGGVCLILGAALVIVATRPRPIHYVPAADASGLSWPQRVPAASVLSFATAWLMDWTNYSPETASATFERSLRFMAPPLASRLRAGLKEELERIARDRLSSAFTLTGAGHLRQKGTLFEVDLQGSRAVYMGKEELSVEDVRFVLTLSPAPPTETDPYGLVITGIIQERRAHGTD